MERGERNGEGGAENLWGKLRRVVKRGGHSTPAALFLRTKQLHDTTNLISSRKLAAALWELHHYKLPRHPYKDMDDPDPPLSSFEMVKGSSLYLFLLSMHSCLLLDCLLSVFILSPILNRVVLLIHFCCYV